MMLPCVEELERAVQLDCYGDLRSNGLFDVPLVYSLNRLPVSVEVISDAFIQDVRESFSLEQKPIQWRNSIESGVINLSHLDIWLQRFPWDSVSILDSPDNFLRETFGVYQPASITTSGSIASSMDITLRDFDSDWIFNQSSPNSFLDFHSTGTLSDVVPEQSYYSAFVGVTILFCVLFRRRG